MQKKEEITCRHCGKTALKRKSELNRWRKKGRDYFFCCGKCSAQWISQQRPDLRRDISKTCPVCGSSFATISGSREATFCSRSCASAGSVSEYRIQRAIESGAVNLIQSGEIRAAALRSRESWKYVAVQNDLIKNHVRHQFEYSLPGSRNIFDLALFDSKLLVEFDGPDHKDISQIKRDRQRDATAAASGWFVIRISVNANEQIAPQEFWGGLEAHIRANRGL